MKHRKWLKCLTALIMSTVFIAPVPSSYAVAGTAENYIIEEHRAADTSGFEIENGVLVNYTGTDADVVIPDGVTSIGAGAFNSNKKLISVRLPDSVTEIGNGAFVVCENLQRINFPKHLVSIGDGAFYHCDSLKAAIFPESLSMIGEEAFHGCWNLSDILIPGNVTVMGEGAFANCMSVTSVIISEGVKNIGVGAFYRCMDLTTVVIPESVTDIEDGAFDMTCGPTIYGIEGSYAQAYAAEHNFSFSPRKESKPEMFDIRDGVLVGYSGTAVDIVIPKGVTSIADSVFEDTTYENGDWVYGEKLHLLSVTIPEGVTSIGDKAFLGCKNLMSVSIPSSVTSIGSLAFWKTKWLEIKSADNPLVIVNNILLDGDKASGEVVIPEGVTSIAGQAFSGCKALKGIRISSSAVSIGDYAFSGCENLESVNIPSAIKFIGAGAFRETKWLEMKKADNPLVIVNNILIDAQTSGKDITIPEGVTDIAGGAFWDCENLVRITIPESVVSIERNVFTGCSSNLVLIVVKGSYAETYVKENHIKYAYAGGNGNPSYFHNWETLTTKATVGKNGAVTQTCTKCGEKTTTTIYAPTTIKLSKTSFTYNNKNQSPSVTVKDSKGKALKNNTDYTVSFPKDMKNVGQYTVTITFKGNYSGTVDKTVTIVPKGTSISKVTPKKKSFAVKWKKQEMQTTGYEIACSTDSKFSGKNTTIVPVGKNNTTAKTVTKLNAKKKYYVRIRTYKTVGGKKYYSDWSGVKNVTTK